jgi:hypothetical protein
MITITVIAGNRKGKFSFMPTRTIREIAEALHLSAKSLFIQLGNQVELLKENQTLAEFGEGNLKIISL